MNNNYIISLENYFPVRSFFKRFISYIIIIYSDFMEKCVRIEKTASNDAEILAKLSKEAFHTDSDIGGPEGPGGPPGYDSPKFQKWCMRNLTYYKILYDGEIVGGIILNSKKANHHILERIFVDPRYHNKGIATKAINLIFIEYPDVIWTLGTPEWNGRTRHFYEKLYFNQIGWDDGDGEINWRGIWYQRTTDKTTSSVQNIIDLNDGMTEVVVEGEIVIISPKKMGKNLLLPMQFYVIILGKSLWSYGIHKSHR